MIAVGCNPNVKEDCGVTPLTIAVLLHDKNICQQLASCGASIKGPLFVNVPSPLAVAEKLELTEMCKIMQSDSSDDEDEVISSYHTSFRIPCCCVDKRKDIKEINRSCDGYITGVVGDVGNCKNNRSVMARSKAYSWTSIIPRDWHTKGHIVEACFKEQGPASFHYIVNKIMKRPKLVNSAFKKKTFEHSNLLRIREATRDGARAYGISVVIEFAGSDFYPTDEEKTNCSRPSGSHTDIFLEKIQAIPTA